jgi:hypothetical protein
MMLTPLPNTRSAIVPEPGMAFVEVDLRQADAQAVAWMAGAQRLKSLLGRRMDIYTELETGVWADAKLALVPRQTRKNVIHSSNYGGGARTISDRYIHDLHSTEYFLDAWFGTHHEIREWHMDIEHQMKRSRTPQIRNVWGFRRVYAMQVPITQPLAWLGQSTISICKDHMMLRVHDEAPWATLKMEYHDSLLLQLPRRMCPDRFEEIIRMCDVEIPFADPLHIPVELKWSTTNWGEMEEWHG